MHHKAPNQLRINDHTTSNGSYQLRIFIWIFLLIFTGIHSFRKTLVETLNFIYTNFHQEVKRHIFYVEEKKITISSLKIFSLEQWIRSVYIKYRRLNGWDFWFHVSDLLAPELEKNVPQINKFRWVSGKDITFY